MEKDALTVLLFFFSNKSVPTDPAIMKQTTFRGPATIQLATLKSSIVIQLVKKKNGKRTKACAPILNAVLQDESIIKVGCGIDQDLLQLGWKKLEARSRLNLADVISSDQTLGLETLSQSILRINLPKTQSVARSNWSNIPLSDRQLNYAARDAWAGAAIVHALKRRYKCFEPSYLCDYLKGQPSLELLKNQYQCQEQAKTLIKTLLLPYKGNKAAVPRWKKTYIGQVNRLEKDIHLDQLKPLLNATAIGI